MVLQNRAAEFDVRGLKRCGQQLIVCRIGQGRFVELNESYETDLNKVGEEMNANNIPDLTNEAYPFMVDWNVRAVTIDGLFNFSDGSSQIYHATGLDRGWCYFGSIRTLGRNP